MTTHKHLTIPLIALAAAAGAFISGHADAGGAPFEMSAYTNSPGGPEIMAGDYAAAIAAAKCGVSGFDSTSLLVGATNLCVAYTVRRAFEKAVTACNEAVTLAASEESDLLGRPHEGPASAKALSNRGVLRALMGRPAAAAADFHKAMALGGSWPAPSRNLAHLETRASYRVARAEGAADVAE